MEKFNVTVEQDSRDCDGPMYHKPVELRDVSREELNRQIGEFVLQYASISKEWSETGMTCTLIGYTKTDEGFNRGELSFYEVEVA